MRRVLTSGAIIPFHSTLGPNTGKTGSKPGTSGRTIDDVSPRPAPDPDPDPDPDPGRLVPPHVSSASASFDENGSMACPPHAAVINPTGTSLDDRAYSSRPWNQHAAENQPMSLHPPYGALGSGVTGGLNAFGVALAHADFSYAASPAVAAVASSLSTSAAVIATVAIRIPSPNVADSAMAAAASNEAATVNCMLDWPAHSQTSPKARSATMADSIVMLDPATSPPLRARMRRANGPCEAGWGGRRTIHSPVPAAAEVRAVARTARGGRIRSASFAMMALASSDSTPPSSAGSFVSSTVTSAPGAAQPHTAARAGALWSTALDPRNVGSLSERGSTGAANAKNDNAATRT